MVRLTKKIARLSAIGVLAVAAAFVLATGTGIVANNFMPSATALPSKQTCNYYDQQMLKAEESGDLIAYNEWKQRYEGGHCSSADQGSGSGKGPGMLCNFKDSYYETCGLDRNRYE